MGTRGRTGRGLTLAETLVVIGVFAVLLLTILQLLKGGIAAWQKGNTQTTLRAGVRKALDDVTADLRTMVRGSPQTPAAVVTTFTFNRTINNPSGTPPYTDVATTYTIDNATQTLRRTEGGVTVIVAENIVHTDPRPASTNPRSFFQSYDAVGSKVYVQLCSVDAASSGSLVQTLATRPAEMTLGTTVVCFNYQKDDALAVYAAVRALAPATLDEPGRPFRRASPTPEQ